MRMRTTITVVMAMGLAACAAGRKGAEAPPAAAPAEPAASGYAQQPATPGRASTSPDDAKPPPPSSQPSTPTAGGPFAPAPRNRAAALNQASTDIEASQRELDVAGGDCRNACRALGSMDRAAGRLCGLAQSSEEIHRCDDVKTRVYAARDKVRNTCGSCPDVSVDRNAPIPSH